MFWKILFFIYLAYLLLLNSAQYSDIAQSDISAGLYSIFGVVYTVYAVILTLVYFYALGWQKRVIAAVNNRYVLLSAVVLMILMFGFFCYQEYSYLHGDMLMYAMRQGMVPRNPDFQALLWITRFEIIAYALIRIFLIFAPFALGYYFYSKRMNNFNEMKFPGRKIFSIFLFLNSLPLIVMSILAFIEDFVTYNFFDILTILCTIYIIVGVYGYAFNRIIHNQSFWRITMPIFTFVGLLPSSINSGSFQKLTQAVTFQADPVIYISNLVIFVGALYLIWKYAYTDEIFRKDVIVT